MWLQNKLLNLLIEQKNQLIKLLGEYERDAKASASRPKPEPEPVDPEEKVSGANQGPAFKGRCARRPSGYDELLSEEG